MKLILVANPQAPNAEDAFCREIAKRAPQRGHRAAIQSAAIAPKAADAAIVNGPQAAALAAARAADLPVILRLVDPVVAASEAAAADFKTLAAACRRILVPSVFMKETVARWGVPGDRIRVVPYAYDHHYAQQIAVVTMRASRPATFGLIACGPADRSGVAGLETVLSAVARLRMECSLSVVGTGPALETLKARAQALTLGSRVNFPGDLHPAKMMEHLRAAKAYIEPSERQGFPFLALDAMSQGCPVVGADVGAIPELIRDGDNGLLYRAGDAQSLSEQLTNLASTPGLSLKLIEGGARSVEERSWDRTTEAVLDVVENLEVNA